MERRATLRPSIAPMIERRASGRIPVVLRGFAMKLVPSGRRLMRGVSDVTMILQIGEPLSGRCNRVRCRHSAGEFHVGEDYRKAPATGPAHELLPRRCRIAHVHFALFEEHACERSLHFIVFDN